MPSIGRLDRLMPSIGSAATIPAIARKAVITPPTMAATFGVFSGALSSVMGAVGKSRARSCSPMALDWLKVSRANSFSALLSATLQLSSASFAPMTAALAGAATSPRAIAQVAAPAMMRER